MTETKYRAFHHNVQIGENTDLGELMQGCKSFLKGQEGCQLITPVLIVNVQCNVAIYLITDDANGLKVHIL